jgi:predicted HAD superfamily phosphohydrolase
MSQLLLLERIAELLEREHDAIATIDLDSLAAIEDERRPLLAELTPIVPAERDALRVVEDRRARNELAAVAALSRLGDALGRVGRGRTALEGYRPTAGSSLLSRALDQEV